VYIKLGSQKIHYYDHGEGDVIILLHGFMESVFMWKSLSERLSQRFRVLSVDLPGHGKSDVFENDLSIDHMATLIQQLLLKLNLHKVNIVGHSMGGYVTLSFVEHYPTLVNSFILLNSKAGDDSDEVKRKRKLGVQMLDKHPHFVVKESITNLFRAETRKDFLDEISGLVEEGQKGSYKGYADALVAMMHRPDRKKVLQNDVSKLYVAGKFDPVIPFELSKGEMHLIKKCEYKILSHSGHMGFIEEKKLCEDIIEDFLVRQTRHQ